MESTLGFKARRIEFISWFYLGLAVRPLEADASSLNLGFVICTMGRGMFTFLNLRSFSFLYSSHSQCVFISSTPDPPTPAPMQRHKSILIKHSVLYFFCSYKAQELGSPRGSVVKNPPANAGDTGSIPGPGRSHMLWSN